MSDSCTPGPMDEERIRSAVRSGYARIAEAGNLAAATCGCCGGSGDAAQVSGGLAAKLGYDKAD